MDCHEVKSPSDLAEIARIASPAKSAADELVFLLKLGNSWMRFRSSYSAADLRRMHTSYASEIPVNGPLSALNGSHHNVQPNRCPLWPELRTFHASPRSFCF